MGTTKGRTILFLKGGVGKNKSLVRPTLEYGSTVWDPYRSYQKNWLKQVQRRAVRFVTETYTREESCVANALKQLNWPTLEKRRQVARLTLIYKSLNDQAAIIILSYVQHQSSLKTRSSHPLNLFCSRHPMTLTSIASGQELPLTGIVYHLNFYR